MTQVVEQLIPKQKKGDDRSPSCLKSRKNADFSASLF